VIPQFVDGDSWKTSMFFVNLESYSVSFQVLFFDDGGNDMTIPILGQGPIRGLNVSLEAAGSITFESAGTASRLTQGWALLSQSTNDSVGGMAIFRQSVFGREQEAVVPIVSQYNNHFVLLFDNTNFTTAIALANPSGNAVEIPVNIRNQAGQIIDQRTIQLGSYCHTAFTLPDTWVSTAGRRGAIEFLTSGFGVGALGLRFSGSAFTSFHVLENLNWVVNPPLSFNSDRAQETYEKVTSGIKRGRDPDTWRPPSLTGSGCISRRFVRRPRTRIRERVPRWIPVRSKPSGE
jgi:hypothetical protein